MCGISLCTRGALDAWSCGRSTAALAGHELRLSARFSRMKHQRAWCLSPLWSSRFSISVRPTSVTRSSSRATRSPSRSSRPRRLRGSTLRVSAWPPPLSVGPCRADRHTSRSRWRMARQPDRMCRMHIYTSFLGESRMVLGWRAGGRRTERAALSKTVALQIKDALESHNAG